MNTAEIEYAIRRIVSEIIAQIPANRHGIVQSVDPTRATVRVAWDEDGTLSGHLPIVQAAVGNGWSMVTLPPPGTQVFCAPDMHDSGSMVVMGPVHSSAMPPGRVTPYKATSAVPLVPGEPTIMGPDGQFIRLPAGGGIQSRGTWMHDGNIITSGSIATDGDITTKTQVTAVVDVIAGGNAISLVHHRHISYDINGNQHTTSEPL